MICCEAVFDAAGLEQLLRLIGRRYAAASPAERREIATIHVVGRVDVRPDVVFANLDRPNAIFVKVNWDGAGATGRECGFFEELGPQVSRELPLYPPLLLGDLGGFGPRQVGRTVATDRLLCRVFRRNWPKRERWGIRPAKAELASQVVPRFLRRSRQRQVQLPARG